MNNKASLAVWVIIIFFVILIAGGITIAIVLGPKETKKPAEDQMVNVISYVKPMDADANQPVKSQYSIYYVNNQNIRVPLSSGKLEDSYNEITLVKGYRNEIYCWDDNYYLGKAEKTPTDYDLSNKSSFDCLMHKIGNLTVASKGTLANTFNVIQLDFSTPNTFQNLGVCVAWTPGIISVASSQNIVYCNNGFWINTTTDNQNHTIQLTDSQFMCGDGWIEKCANVQGSSCEKPIDDIIPLKYKRKVDRCFYIGYTLNNNTYSMSFQVKTLDFKNSFDYVKFYIFDMDKEISGGKIQMTSDVGYDDIEYTIPYSGGQNASV